MHTTLGLGFVEPLCVKERCVKERGGSHSGGDGTAVRGEGEWWLAGMPRLMCVLVNGL